MIVYLNLITFAHSDSTNKHLTKLSFTLCESKARLRGNSSCVITLRWSPRGMI